MASLIKDMPNEPITYLIRMLQKADQRLRSPRGAPVSCKLIIAYYKFDHNLIVSFFQAMTKNIHFLTIAIKEFYMIKFVFMKKKH